MQTFNQIGSTNIMPLMMNFTVPTPIQESDEIHWSYNDGEQISYDMRTVCTLSKKLMGTKCGPHCSKSDYKNGTDDSKNVK